MIDLLSISDTEIVKTGTLISYQMYSIKDGNIKTAQRQITWIAFISQMFIGQWWALTGEMFIPTSGVASMCYIISRLSDMLTVSDPIAN